MANGALARRIEELFPQTVQAELAQIEAQLGGRDQVVGLLTLAPLTGDLRYLLGMLGDPKHQSKSLAEVCAISNVLPGKLLEHLVGAALLRGKVRASQKIGDGIAAVAEDVMRRAAPYEDACSDCRGIGSITPDPSAAQPNPSPGPCETCAGTGKLRYLPELDRQKLAIEMAQLLPKGGGIQIAMQQNAGGASSGGGGGMLERLQQVTDQILYGEAPGGAPSGVIDAEPVPCPSPEPEPEPEPPV